MCSAYKLKKQGDNIQPWRTPFPTWKQSVLPCPVLTVASWTAYKFLKRQVRWSGIPISFRFFQFVVIYPVNGFSIVNGTEVDVFFWNSLAFSRIQQLLAIWSLVPLPFLNPPCTSGSSWFTYYWSLAWRILNITLHVKWVQLYGSLNILWHCSSLGLEWKLTYSSPTATVEFPKFADILSAAF